MRLKQYLLEKFMPSQASHTTTLQESLHCVGLGITQLNSSKLNEELFYNNNLFTKSYDKYCKVNASIDEMLVLLDNDSWRKSIINNINKLKASGYLKANNYIFYRGTGLMKDIYNQFNILKSKDKIRLANDKWNPGDIWALKPSIRNIPSFDNLMEYNAFLSDELKKGNIISISLKKSKGNPKVVLSDHKSIVPIKYNGAKTPKSIFNTGIVILTDNPKITINVRSYHISKREPISAELQIKGTGARHGKKTISGYKKKYTIPLMNNQQLSKYEDDIDYLKNEVITQWNDLGFTFSQQSIEKDWNKRKNNIQDTVGYFKSIINSLIFTNYLKSHSEFADNIINDIFVSASSMGKYSSNFIKVY